MTPTMFVLCGLPASGKSTLAAAYAAEGRAVVLSVDEIRTAGADPQNAFRWLHSEAMRILGSGGSVIADTCALRSFERGRLHTIGRRADARVELVIVNTPWRLCCERNAAREHPARVNWLHGASLLQAALHEKTVPGYWDALRIVNGWARGGGPTP